MRPDNDKPRLKSFKDWLQLVYCGMCMGAADIVPGISGGTIAFIMGFYPNLLASIKTLNLDSLKLLIRFKFKEFFSNIAWEFMAALFLGITFSFLCLAHFFDYVLGHETYRIFLYAGFSGLILASVIFCSKQVSNWNLRLFFFLVIGAIIAYSLTGTSFQFISKESVFDVKMPLDLVVKENLGTNLENYDSNTQMLLNVQKSSLAAMLAKGIISKEALVYSQDHAKYGSANEFVQPYLLRGIDWWIVGCGAIAISAMLLPGISGSYLLTVLGMYGVVIGALADFIEGIKHFHFDTDAFLILMSILIGIILGGLFFARFVSWLLKSYHDIAIAMLTGFMIGAARSVWPFWTYAYYLNPLKIEKGPQLKVLEPFLPSLTSSILWQAALFAIAGFCLVFLVEFLASRKNRQINKEPYTV